VVPWSRKRRQVKEATANRDIACLKVLFRKAVEWGKLEESPAKGLKSFKEIPNPPRLLEPEEITRLLEEVPHRLKALVGCAVYAGLRKQELFYLRREDANLKTGELSVVSRREHHTKNYKTRRIPINEALDTLLRSHPRRLGSPYLFCNKDGEPYDNVKTAMRSAAERASIEGGVGLQQLRHAFCSHALMQGIDPRTVQKWMGHRDLATTLGHAHVSPDHEKTAIQRLRYDTWHQDGTKVEGT
jgi:site-specific recombinase XerD